MQEQVTWRRWLLSTATSATTGATAGAMTLITPAMCGSLAQTPPTTPTRIRCAQGTVMSSVLPAQGSRSSLSPSYEVHYEDLEHDCQVVFGTEVPKVKAPWFARERSQPAVDAWRRSVYQWRS